MELVRTEDPDSFLGWAGEWLARDPVLGTVVTTTLRRAADHPEVVPDHPRWWGVVREGGDIVGVVMRTAPFVPHPLYLLPMPDAAALLIARELHAAGETIAGANGATPAIEVLGAEVARLQGGRSEVVERTRLFVLDELADLVAPAPVPGRLRRATSDDLEIVVAWFRDFLPAAARQAGRPVESEEHFRPGEVEGRVAAGVVHLWEVDAPDGRQSVVHLTARNETVFGVSRIGPVYTPVEQRGKGYAAAAVAQLTREVLEAGDRACLFTDQANPVSNHIYPAMGYRAVTDMAQVRITPS